MDNFIITPQIVLQALVGGISVGAIYALIAVGYNLIFSTTRVLNFAQGEFLMVGALVAVTFMVDVRWPFPLALAAVILILGVVGILAERLIMIPVRRAGGLSWILTTLGASIILRNVAALIYGQEPRRLPALVEGRLPIEGVIITYQQIAIVLLAILLVILNELFAHRTFFGKAIRATAHSYDVAALMGIPVGLMISLSFAISAVMTGLAGVLIAPTLFADANMGLLLGLKGFVAVVVGGLGSARGALVGGMLVGLLDTFVRSVIPSDISNFAVFALLALMLLFRPTGIMGQTISERH